ncbi:hypothetical protein D0T12_04790 [Actinomadura spongiicola]|uniref:Uncharacterized protein n=1 Tax=Actinomadura spongiicola TaxID=2303421 RepID=A0A372GLI4_9ACTN|nr:hypothetical protein D0T12_04790 [Actinomadura spongiicola]
MFAGAGCQDRIVDEALATGGDLRRLCDLFSVTIATAEHYAAVLNYPCLATDGPSTSSQTEVPVTQHGE